MTTRLAWLSVLLLVDCSGTGCNDGEGSADVGQPDHDAGDAESGTDASVNPACNDASQGTRWAGWSRVTEVNACCTVEVPDNVGTSIAPLTWVACLNGDSNCREMAANWVAPNGSRFEKANVVGNVINMWRALDTSFGEADLYDLASGSPIAGWRTYLSPDTPWEGQPIVGATSLWVFIFGTGPSDPFPIGRFAHADLYSSLHPSPFYEAPASSVGNNGIQDLSASDTTVAFDVEPPGIIGFARASNPSAFVFTSMGGMINPLVVNDTVLAKSNAGNAGWGQENLIGAGGSVVTFRATPNTQVDNFACDGTTLFWTEGSGGAAGSGIQPVISAWAAPFTSDASTLVSTAHKLADISGGGFATYGIAYNGYYAVRTAQTLAVIVRGSDGAKQQLIPGTNRVFGPLSYVTATELWSLAGAANNGPSGTAFQRQQLAAWP